MASRLIERSARPTGFEPLKSLFLLTVPAVLRGLLPKAINMPAPATTKRPGIPEDGRKLPPRERTTRIRTLLTLIDIRSSGR